MRKMLVKFVLPLIAMFLIVGKAHALDYDKAYMVTGSGSTTLSNYNSGTDEYTYSLTQKPWVYLKLKFDELNLSAPLHVLWSWTSFSNPSNNETKLETFTLTGLGGDKEVWSAAPEPWWTNNGGQGKWTVDLAWLNFPGSLGTSSATFNVTPEPVSSALFFFGGVPVAAALLRRKKTTKV